MSISRLGQRTEGLDWLNAGAVCFNFNLRRTARAVTQYYDEVLKPSGIKVTQFTILMAIATRKDHTITEIARLAQHLAEQTIAVVGRRAVEIGRAHV